MAEIKLTISAENRQAIAALQQVATVANQTGSNVNKAGATSGSGFTGATGKAGNFLDMLSKITIVAAGIIGAFRILKDLAEKVFGSGFDFVKDMEMNQLGIAGILQSMTLMNGKAVAFSGAMAISADMMKKLQEDAVKTAATTGELVTTFRAILAPGIGAGMNLDQIRQLTVAGVNAVKSIMPANQDAQRQMVQELRDLVQGGIQAASSTLATALGITDADIERAKNSSDGLFKFLMDRLQGFDETAKRFPNTISGRIDQLKEVWERGSAAFVQEFADPIKEFLSDLTGLVGAVNTETGKIELNPTLLATINEVNNGFKELKDLGQDLEPSFRWVNDDLLPGLKDVWTTLKNIGTVIGDTLRINLKAAQPVLEFFAQGFKDLAHDVAEVTGYLKELSDFMARRSGAKPSAENSEISLADINRDSYGNTLPDVQSLNITQKFPDTKKAVENSQAALKMALSAIEADAKKATTDIKREQENIEVLYKQSLISAEEYSRRKIELETKAQQVAVDEAQRKLETIQGALYDKDIDKQTAVGKANNELDVQVQKLKDLGVSVSDVKKAIDGMTGAGITWRKEVENVNTEGLQNNAKSAVYAMAAYFYKLTGQQMVVSSGLREWGGHVSGTKFDVVDSASSELLEKNVNGIRDKMIAYAQSIGLQVLDEYDNPSANATGGHLDINAKDFPGTFAAQAKARIGPVLTKSGLDYLNAIVDLMQQADDIVKELAEARGDVSSRQKAELTVKYSDLIQKFQTNGMTEAVKNVKELQKAQFLKLDFAQAQKDLENANGQLADSQESLMNDFADGSKSATEVTDQYSADYRTKTDKIVAELQRIAKEAGEGTELSNSAKSVLRQIAKSVNAFADAVIQRIDSDLQNEIARINANRNMTNLQKEDAIEAVQRAAYASKAGEYEKEATEFRNNGQIGEAKSAEQAVALNRALAETPSILDKIHEASRQGLEDGLLEFLERGIIECRNLGEAFRNLVVTVLQSIQKIYAQEMTKRLMSMFGFGAQSSRPTVSGVPVQGLLLSNGTFAEGGHIESGKVTGPGTGTSDNILAYVGNLRKFIQISNGEYVIRANAVAKWGTRFLDNINSGRVPSEFLQTHRRFASGGSIGVQTVAGPKELAASLVNNNSTSIPLKIVNVTDPNEVGRYLASRPGEKVMVNWIKNNAETVRQLLKIRG